MADLNKPELVIVRLLDAPIDKVWQAWTNARSIEQWWGPRGVTIPTCEWEAKSGGKINIVMLAGPELGPMSGQEWPMMGEFVEVSPPQKLVFNGSAMANGQAILKTLNSLTLEDQAGKTKMTLKIQVIETTLAAEGPLAGMEIGWNQSLDKLTEFVRGRH
ncbi:MAG TPA: SRPBCC domain-containing protein [Candidatus Binatia bacterium]|nr:SRPBCC domain-containing protein [Candidatus Binatia bacterium]